MQYQGTAAACSTPYVQAKSGTAELGPHLEWCCQLQSAALSNRIPEHIAVMAATCSTRKPSYSGHVASHLE